jgi:hypothetical protein
MALILNSPKGLVKVYSPEFVETETPEIGELFSNPFTDPLIWSFALVG